MDVSENFYAELYATSSDTNDDGNIGRCLISQELLTEHAVTLECGHSFNYVSLYNNVLHAKYKSGPYASKIGYSCIICPYCRHIHPKLMPYIPLDDVYPVYGVNSSLLYKPRDICCMHATKRNGYVCNNTILKNYPNGKYYCYKHRVNMNASSSSSSSSTKEPICTHPTESVVPSPSVSIHENTTNVIVSESTGQCIYVFKKGVKKGKCCQVFLKMGNITQYCSKHSPTSIVASTIVI
jgi:hypothetical protein